MTFIVSKMTPKGVEIPCFSSVISRTEAQRGDGTVKRRTSEAILGPIKYGVRGAGGVQGQHVLPGPVKKGYHSPPVGAGEAHFARCLQVRHDLLRGKAGGSQAVRETGAEQRGQVSPEQPRHIEAHKGVSAVAVYGQKTGAAPQFDDVQIPAETPVAFAAVGQRLLVQKPLQGKGQPRFHQGASWEMTIFSTRMEPLVTSARIRVISW